MFSRTSIFILFALSAMAQQPDFFPLHRGNQWIYRISGFAAGGPPIVVEVSAIRQINNRTYAVVTGLDEETLLLRQSDDNRLLILDEGTGRELVWAAFNTPEGQTFPTEVDPCNRTGRVESRSARVTTPAAQFSNALAISYPPGNCADAGLASEAFVPYIGLVERRSQTIGGPRVMSLIYARVGGVTVLSEPEVAFGLTVDQTRFVFPGVLPPGGLRPFTLNARITVRATQPQPVELNFPTSQRYDLAIKNEAGDIVARWSDGKAFAQVLGTERIGPGEKNWAVSMPVATRDGNVLGSGKYTLEAWLTTTGERRYSASVGFEIMAAP